MGFRGPSAGAGAPVALVAPGELAPVNLDLRGLKTADDFYSPCRAAAASKGESVVFVLFSSAFAKELKASEASVPCVYLQRDWYICCTHRKGGLRDITVCGGGAANTRERPKGKHT